MKQRFLIFLTFSVITNMAFGVSTQHNVNFKTSTDVNTSTETRLIHEGQYRFFLDEWMMGGGYLLAPGKSPITGYHLHFGYHQLFLPELSVQLKFLNRVYREFDIGENSIIPWISWKDKVFEADLGVNIRFTNFNPLYTGLIFYYPEELVQFLLLYRVAFYQSWETEGVRLGVELKNHDWNYAGNSFSISLHIDALFRVAKELSIQLNVGITPSGLSGVNLELNRFTFFMGAHYRL